MHRVLLSPVDMLSPILEQGESFASPHPPTARAADLERSLPDLIIEPERYERDDETEEFYDELEVKMKQLYKVLFLRESFTEELFNKSVPNYSYNETFDDVEDGNDRHNRGEVDDDDEEDATPERDDGDSELSQDVDNEESQGVEKTTPETENRTTSKSDGETLEPTDKATTESEDRNLNESREEIVVTDSEPSYTTSLESAEKSEDVQEELAGIEGKISNEQDKIRTHQADICLEPSQTFTEKIGPLEDSSSNESLDASRTFTVQAIIHKWTARDDRELEVMRRQTMYSVEDSFRNIRESNDDGLDLSRRSTGQERCEPDFNLERHSIGNDRSTTSTVPLDTESFVHPSRVSSPRKRVSSPRISSPFKEVSPVLACKRPSSFLPNVPAKKKFTAEKEQMSQQCQIAIVAAKVSQSDKEIQVNISIPLSTENVDTQTDFQDSRDEAQTSADQHDDDQDNEAEVPREPERVQTATQIEDSFGNDYESAHNDKLDSNISFSAESENDGSTNYSSVPMDIECFVHPSRISSPRSKREPLRSIINTLVPLDTSRSSSALKRVSSPRISSPYKEVSPVLACKRPASAVHVHMPTKRKFTGQKQQTTLQAGATAVVTANVSQSDKEIQVNIPILMSSANIETQTDFQDRKDGETQTTTDHPDVAADMSQEPERVNMATQTERIETNNEGTQTQFSFEYYRLFDGINFMFFF